MQARLSERRAALGGSVGRTISEAKASGSKVSQGARKLLDLLPVGKK